MAVKIVQKKPGIERPETPILDGKPVIKKLIDGYLKGIGEHPAYKVAGWIRGVANVGGTPGLAQELRQLSRWVEREYG